MGVLISGMVTINTIWHQVTYVPNCIIVSADIFLLAAKKHRRWLIVCIMRHEENSQVIMFFPFPWKMTPDINQVALESQVWRIVGIRGRSPSFVLKIIKLLISTMVENANGS